jgi:hypothetical protein
MSTNNTFATATIPAAIGSGPGVDVSGMAESKTFTLPPFGVGTIAVEVSADGVSYAPLFTMNGPSGEPQTSTVSAACNMLRVRRLSGGDAASSILAIAAEDGDPFFGTLALDGTPLAVDSSFSAKTLVVTGDFTGEIIVTGSADGNVFNPVQGIAINGPGVYRFDATYVLMRVDHVEVTSGNITSVSLGAVGTFVGPAVTAITSASGSIDVQPPFGTGNVNLNVTFGDGSEMNSLGQANDGGVIDEAARIDHTHAAALGILNFSGVLVGGGGAVFSYLANEGVDAVANNAIAFRYSSSPRQFLVMRVTAISDSAANPVTVTLYHNGAPTAMQVSIPAGTDPYQKFVDNTDAVFIADGEDYDVRMDNAAADAGTVKVSVSLEYSLRKF